MSDPIRSISQNNFLLAAQQEVSHDNTLSGNGTEESPLGVSDAVMVSSKLDVTNNKITGYDGTPIGEGSTYSAGQYISIDNDTISVTGLQPSGQYLVPEDLNGYATTQDVEAATSGKADASAIPSLEGYATESWVNEQGYATQQYVTSQVSGKLDTSSYVAPVNSDWNASTGLAQILNKPDTEELSAGPGIAINSGVISVSGQYLTQADLAGYATQTWVGQQGYLTSIPSTYATDSEVADAVAAGTSGKQNKLTSINDVQLVNALPASPVATTLYLIPEA